MTNCVTGKRCFEAQSLAEEALIQNQIINNYRTNEGPKNVYLCGECGDWHFTSKGDPHPMFEDEVVKQRIKRERLANNWERSLR